MFKKEENYKSVDTNLEYGRNEGEHTPQNKGLVGLIKDITGGFVLPVKDGSRGHDYVVVIRGTKTLVFNVVGEKIYLSGTMLGKDFAYVDNKRNPVSVEVVKLISKLL